MIALQIADIKTFMKQFLLSGTFDHFLLLEGNVTTFAAFHIDGTLHPSYFNTQEQELLENRSLSFWGEVRPFCLELIKGKRTPLSFRFTRRIKREMLDYYKHIAYDSIHIRRIIFLQAC